MLGALVGAAIPSIVGGIFGHVGQSSANQANAQQAELNRRFQERMSSTAVQRAVADYKAAGLNPALAYGQGGASAPAGSTAQMQSTLTSAAGNAANVATTLASLLATKAQVEKTNAETDLTKQEKQIRGATFEKITGPKGVADVQVAQDQAWRSWRLNQPDQVAVWLEQMRADLENTRAHARESNSSARLNELANRPLIADALQRLKESDLWKKMLAPFETNAWQTYMKLQRR